MIVPENAIEVAGLIVGLIFGLLLGTSGFSYSGKSEDLSKNARFLNAKLVVFGLAGTLIDWNVLKGKNAPDVDHWRLAGVYVEGVFASLATVVLLTCIGISLAVVFLQRSADVQSKFLVGVRWMFGYLSFGIGFFMDESKTLLTQLREAAVLERERKRQEEQFEERVRAISKAHTKRLEDIARTDRFLAYLFSGVQGHHQAPTDESLRKVVDDIFKGMLAVIEFSVPDSSALNLRINYMKAISFPEAERLYKGKGFLKFVWGQTTRYSCCLVLERYMGGAWERNVALPVDEDPNGPTLLPGAPSAYWAQDLAYMDLTSLRFRSGVPRNVQKEIQAYFAAVEYRSVTSLPLIFRTERVGVVNIESRLPLLVGQSETELQRLVGSLTPYCMLLSVIISQ